MRHFNTPTLRLWGRSRVLNRRSRRTADQYLEWLETESRFVRDGKVKEGRNGWLFLADDENAVLEQHCGERRLSPRRLERWQALLQQRMELLDRHGCRYVMLIAPDTHAVYREHLPHGTKLTDERPVHQLMKHLAEAGVPAEVVYPLEQMRAGRGAHLVCSPIDSHWTEYGAYVAYTSLIEHLSGSVDLRPLGRAEVAFHDMISGGDLGNKLQPARRNKQPFAIVRFPNARLRYDNCVENTGGLVETACALAPDSTCLILGDSYSYPLMKFMSESFRRVVLAHSAALDPELIERVEPDVVVNLMAERFLIEVPEDGARSFREQEMAKRAARRTRPPLAHWWGVHTVSAAQVEHLRDYFLAEGRMREATMTSVLAYAGLLPRELLRLRWSDVESGQLRVRRSGGSQRSGGVPARTVRLIEPLAEDLREWRNSCGEVLPRGLIFPGPTSADWVGGEWDQWRREQFDPGVRASGLQLVRPHDLRHTFCTLLLHEGVSLGEIARQTGMRKSEVKELYAFLLTYARAWDSVEPAELVRLARRRSSSPETFAVRNEARHHNGRVPPRAAERALDLPSPRSDPSLI